MIDVSICLSDVKERILYETWYRRPAQRRQVHSVQCHHLHQERGGRKLSLLHHLTVTCGHNTNFMLALQAQTLNFLHIFVQLNTF